MWALDAAFLLPEEVVPSYNNNNNNNNNQTNPTQLKVVESYNSNNLVCVFLSVVVARRPSGLIF